MVELGNIAKYVNGFAFKPKDWKQLGKKIIRIQNLTRTPEKFNYTDRLDVPKKYIVSPGDLLISWSATIGLYIWNDESAYLNQHIFKVVLSDKILKKYLYYLRNEIVREMIKMGTGSTYKEISKTNFFNLPIPLPPLEVQQEIVAEIEEEQKHVESSKWLIEINEGKIKDKIAEVWGE